LFVKAIIG